MTPRVAPAAPAAAGLKDSANVPMMVVSEGCGARTAGTPIEPRRTGAQAGLAREPKNATMPFPSASAERELWHGTTSQCGAATQLELSAGDRGVRWKSS